MSIASQQHFLTVKVTPQEGKSQFLAGAGDD
jgi:hypothetical protein